MRPFCYYQAMADPAEGNLYNTIIRYPKIKSVFFIVLFVSDFLCLNYSIL